MFLFGLSVLPFVFVLSKTMDIDFVVICVGLTMGLTIVKKTTSGIMESWTMSYVVQTENCFSVILTISRSFYIKVL